MNEEVLVERRGAAGVLTLNRPHALNALTLGMVRAMSEALALWALDDSVTRVIVAAAGERAFCAGGDIRLLYEQGKAGDFDGPLAFWREEYRLDFRIATYPKPFVVLIDGIVMGGGVGISLHASHRIAGDRFSFAMPEVGIGFFPDVGATYLLPRLPGKAGTYFALTGARARAGDAVALGLADAYVPSASLPELLRALETGEDVDALVARARREPPASALAAERPLIDRCFAAPTVADINTCLGHAAAEGSAFAAEAVHAIAQKSPTSLSIALRQMQRGGGLTLEQAFEQEFAIVSRICRGPDFYEGVRALIVDKDNRPVWSPAHLDAIDEQAIEAHFAPLPAGSGL